MKYGTPVGTGWLRADQYVDTDSFGKRTGGPDALYYNRIGLNILHNTDGRSN